MALLVRLLVFAVLLGAAGMSSFADDKDPVKEKLFAAKVAYDGELKQYRKLAGDWFDKREEAARKDGNKKALDLVREDRKVFDESGELPKTAPTTLKQKPTLARKTLEGAYAEAVKAYTKAKKDDEAAAVEKDLENFRKEAAKKEDGALLGTWKVTVGSYKGEWTFKEGGIVDSSTEGAAAGKWVLNTTKGTVVVTWKSGLQDKFDLPLNPRGTAGSQVGRMNLKLEAVKIK